MKKLLVALILIAGLMVSPVFAQDEAVSPAPTVAEKQIKWVDYGLNDGSADVVYLIKSGKVTGGMGFAPITFVDGVLGIRIEYVNELTGDMFDNDLVGVALQVDIKKAVELIPQAKWNLPDLGVKLSFGYMADIEDLKTGEPAMIISIVKVF